MEPLGFEPQVGLTGSLAEMGLAAGGDSLEAQMARLQRANIVQRQAIVTHLGQVQGNRHLQRLVKAFQQSQTLAPEGKTTLESYVQRDTPSEQTDEDDLQTELKQLNGKSMEDLLATLSSMDPGKVSKLYATLPRLAGQVNVPRLTLAFKAIAAQGTSAATFALANREEMTALGHMDQRDALLRQVDAGFKPPRQLSLGDKIMGGKAVIHSQHIRVRKAAGFTWQANNPGAIGSEPSGSGFKVTNYGAYPGKTIGPALIGIFPDEGTGMAALYAWIQYKADKGLSFKSFFSAHAPAPKGEKDKGNVGNQPNLYFEEVARRMGLEPAAVANKPLASVDIPAMAAAMQVQEGWLVGEELSWDDPAIPEEDRFALLYSEWLDPEFAMPPG